MMTKHDETADLMKTLMKTLDVIASSREADRQRIAEAYAEAQILAASIERENGSPRPRIVACFERFYACEATKDATAAAWILMALQERIAEHDLPGWPTLKIVADKAASLLRPSRAQMH